MRRLAILALFAVAAAADGAREAALEASHRSDLTEAQALDAARTLAEAGDAEAVEGVLRLARQHPGVRDPVTPLLQHLRDPQVVRLLGRGALRHTELRPWIIGVLGAVPTSDATEALVRLPDREADRDLLLDALKRRDDPRAAAAVGKLVRAEARGDVVYSILILRRLGYGHPAVAGALAELLHARRWEERIFALDAVGRTREARVALAVAACLEHRVWQVRLAAAEALANIRVKEAVEPLIACLEREERPRVRAAVADALHRITGENLSDYAELWRRWWDRAGKGFRVPRKLPAKRKPRTNETKSVATFYGVPVREERIVFVIDLSASMLRRAAAGRSRFDVATQELLNVVRQLGEHARINVVFFNNEVWRWRRRLGKPSPARLEKELAKRRPSGGTFLWDGLEAAFEHDDVEAIYLLSDGEPSGGAYTGTDEILRAVKKRNQLRRATIHCVAVGRDSPLLRRLAAATGGTYVRR